MINFLKVCDFPVNAITHDQNGLLPWLLCRFELLTQLAIGIIVIVISWSGFFDGILFCNFPPLLGSLEQPSLFQQEYDMTHDSANNSALLKESVDSGDADAQLQHARSLSDGQGVLQDEIH
jgi:hypothetical protein